MMVPAHIEEAVSDAVVGQLERELGARGLLLSAGDLAAASTEAALLGPRLLTMVLRQCYPIGAQEGETLAIEFDSERAAARIEAALVFGAVTARALEPGLLEPAEGLCAMFNLGIGLVDGLCDEDAESGSALLGLLQRRDMAQAVERPRGRGWLRDRLSPPLVDDYSVVFTVDIIETFFETLHAIYPGDAGLELRREIGAQLGAALEAERRSVVRAGAKAARGELIECSRLTSVLPFRVLATLASGGPPSAEPSAATLLGEAMWRIDDLVDLCQDARSGALNALLLEAMGEGEDVVAALERLRTSTRIAAAAAEAAEKLRTVSEPPNVSLLAFIQRYGGISPRPEL